MNPQEKHDRLLEIPNEILEIGTKLAEAKAKFNNLNELTKTVLSSEMMKITRALKGEKQPSEWKCRSAAYISPNYETHLKGVMIAEENYLKLKAQYEAKNAEFEAIRSYASWQKSLGGKI